MKKTGTFHPPTLSSTERKVNTELWQRSLDAFDNKNYHESLKLLLDYINPQLRAKYGNSEGTSYTIPHGSIQVTISIEPNKFHVMAPFLELPQEGVVPLLRQVAGLNVEGIELAYISLKENQLFFEYHCPIALTHPAKIYRILYDICFNGDKYDDEFVSKFGAKRIAEPLIKMYDAETLERVYAAIQSSCNECVEYVKYYEEQRLYGYAWNMQATTLYKIIYFANPQGQLRNDLESAITEHERDDLQTSEIIARTKEVIEKLSQTAKEQWAEDLYFVENFISPKRRSSLEDIQENFKATYQNASKAYAAGDYMGCCAGILYKFYQMYYYNDVQDSVNELVAKALKESAQKPWEEAASILFSVMATLMGDAPSATHGGGGSALYGRFFKNLKGLIQRVFST